MIALDKLDVFLAALHNSYIYLDSCKYRKNASTTKPPPLSSTRHEMQPVKRDHYSHPHASSSPQAQQHNLHARQQPQQMQYVDENQQQQLQQQQHQPLGPNHHLPSSLPLQGPPGLASSAMLVADPTFPLMQGQQMHHVTFHPEQIKHVPEQQFGFNKDPGVNDGIGYCGFILLLLSYVLIFATVPFSLSICLKVVQEYERAVMFRLGRILPGGAKGPGMFFIVPCIDSYTKVDLRTVTFDVPPQEILTRDSVTVAVDAVVYFRIFDPVTSVTNVEDAPKSTQLLAATTLRNVLGTRTLQEILADRESIAHSMQTSLDECTESWGVRVERVEVKDVRLPVQLQRAMAAEAEAAREARAKVIAAEGEHKASRALKEAAEIINESPIALQLRYLQTLTAIASERNSTIVFPIPIELLHAIPLHSSR